MIRAFIFARGGSKGCPGKNITTFVGKPLLAHAIDQALNTIGNVTVSTDSPEIVEIAACYGAQVLLRPSELAQDDSPEWLAWRHAVESVSCDTFVSLPCTAPLRSPEDILNCIDALDGADAVITIARTHQTVGSLVVGDIFEPERSPHFRRQDMPTRYRVAGSCYVTTPRYIAEKESLWGGRVRGVIVPERRAFDIDSPWDLEIARLAYLNLR